MLLDESVSCRRPAAACSRPSRKKRRDRAPVSNLLDMIARIGQPSKLQRSGCARRAGRLGTRPPRADTCSIAGRSTWIFPRESYPSFPSTPGSSFEQGSCQLFDGTAPQYTRRASTSRFQLESRAGELVTEVRRRPGSRPRPRDEAASSRRFFRGFTDERTMGVGLGACHLPGTSRVAHGRTAVGREPQAGRGRLWVTLPMW